MSRRGATDLVGILLLDKPAGMTSHDVVARVRRATGEGRVGHAGTLDPMATGLLVVLIGAYARLAPYLTSATKSYDATITFGSETDTDDAEGNVVVSALPPAAVCDPAYARSVLAGFLGSSSQMPPAYSAIKVGGKTAHKAARAGSPLDLAPREISVEAAALRDIVAGDWLVSFTVSKGTYVRALARDIGRACGSAAHLSALRRTTSGTLDVAQAHSLDEVDAAAGSGDVTALFADPLAALGLPVFEAPGPEVLTGGIIMAPAGSAFPEGGEVAVTRAGRLAAIYRVAGPRLTPAVVFASGGPS